MGKTNLHVVGEHWRVAGPEKGIAWPHQIVSRHPKMLNVLDQIERFGPTEHQVLVQGETGTGKELVARALHRLGAGDNAPFEAINCAAIPRELAESELFGHERGAFTGAVRSHAGVFERAKGGTVFLDEIGDMPLYLQPKLLRVLEEKQVRSLGAVRAQPVSARIIAASNRKLASDARKGRFRLDLYHRLAVGVIDLPPLRERTTDIPLLVGHFLAEEGLRCVGVSLEKDVMPYLMRQSWRGNVRALRAAVLRAAVSGGSLLSRSDFNFLSEDQSTDVPDGCIRYRGRSYQQIKRELFSRVLKQQQGNRSSAARALGIPKSTFSDQLRAMGL